MLFVKYSEGVLCIELCLMNLDSFEVAKSLAFKKKITFCPVPEKRTECKPTPGFLFEHISTTC